MDPARSWLAALAAAMPPPNSRERQAALAAYAGPLRREFPPGALSPDTAAAVGASLTGFPTWDDLATALRRHARATRSQTSEAGTYVACFKRRLAALGEDRLGFLLGIARSYPSEAWEAVEREYAPPPPPRAMPPPPSLRADLGYRPSRPCPDLRPEPCGPPPVGLPRWQLAQLYAANGLTMPKPNA